MSPRGYLECGDTTHFITDCPKKKKLEQDEHGGLRGLSR
jgi:hypothetical protein